jgi:hypothetical protein
MLGSTTKCGIGLWDNQIFGASKSRLRKLETENGRKGTLKSPVSSNGGAGAPMQADTVKTESPQPTRWRTALPQASEKKLRSRFQPKGAYKK